MPERPGELPGPTPREPTCSAIGPEDLPRQVGPYTQTPKRRRRAAAVVVLGIIAAVLMVLWFRRGGPEPAAKEGGTRNTMRWPRDYPDELRARRPDVPVDLLRPALYGKRPPNVARGGAVLPRPRDGPDLRYQPLWDRRLAGTGYYKELRDCLQLAAAFPGPGDGCTFLALDDDRARRWFELKAEVRPTLGRKGDVHPGIFFGWHDTAPAHAGAYLIRVANAPPDGPPGAAGKILVGRFDWPLDNDNEGPLPHFAFTPGNTLGELRVGRATQWYYLRVRAVPGKVSVAVDGGAPFVFAPQHDPRGALGVWAQQGIAQFGKVSVTALEAGDASP